MPLTPNAISEDLKNKDLDRPSAIELLLTLIDNAENPETRIESIKILEEIGTTDEKTFKFLEHLLISDTNENVRNLTCKVLKNLYINKALAPISWAFEHETSLKCLITIISTLGEINQDKSKSVLIDKLNRFRRRKYKYNLNGLFKKRNIKDFSNKELTDILISYYILSSLKLTFGYIKFEINESGLITELDLSNVERYSSGLSKLEKILESIFSLNTIKRCDLRFNHLINIPTVLNRSIEYLDLSYNKITKLPDFSYFKSLKTLNLKTNRLRNLPESIGLVKTLENLNLRNNMLTHLPSSISSLSSLKSLDLHGNKLTSIEINLSASIKELELGWNNFTTIPKEVQPLLFLEKLGMGGNKLVTLPEWIGSFHSLKELELYDNKLCNIPDSLGNLNSLEKLNLRNNQLSNLPSSMTKLKSLKFLNLSWNNFTTLPEWIGILSSLEVFNLWGNKLEKLPNSIASLSSLKILDLNFNKFEELPPLLKEMERKNGLIIKF
ncbi:MAG: leucine-rich repeat domain-containing protein [Promethearchaeota archaeon]